MLSRLQQIIDKGEIRPDDYDTLLKDADKDGVLDLREQAIFRALADLIANKLVCRVSNCHDCPLPDKTCT